MTRSEFATLVQAFVTTHGRAYLTDETELNAFYNERLQAYSARTYCMFDDAIALTLVVDDPLIDVRADLAKVVHRPVAVVIDGVTLQDFDNQNGPVTILELADAFPSYLIAAHGKPVRWSFMPPGTIRLYPKPDDTYSNCFVAGYVLHPEIDTSAGGDDTELSLPIEHQRTAAVFAAIDLLEPNAAADSDYARMRVIDPRAAVDMQRHEKRAEELLSRGTRRRGTRMGTGWRRLGG